MLALIQDHSILIALIWMLLANLAAVGPKWVKDSALVVMLVSAGVIIPAVFRENGLIIGLPIVILMCIQMRWSVFIIRRLFRRLRNESARDA